MSRVRKVYLLGVFDFQLSLETVKHRPHFSCIIKKVYCSFKMNQQDELNEL